MSEDNINAVPASIQTLKNKVKQLNENKKSTRSPKNGDFVNDDFGFEEESSSHNPPSEKEETVLSTSKKINDITKKETSNHKKTPSQEEMTEESLAVAMISESISTSANIINTFDSKIDIGQHFAKFLKRQTKLRELSEKKLNISNQARTHKNITVDLNATIGDILTHLNVMKDEELERRFEMLCEQVLVNREYWRGNERVAPLLSIRAKAKTFEASLYCWMALEDYPFSKDIDKDIMKMFTLVMSLSRDVAQNWKEDLSSIERQQLYVMIIPVIAKIARKKWEISAYNILDNGYQTIDGYLMDFESKVMEHFKPSVLGMQISTEMAKNISSGVASKIKNYQENINHLENKASIRLKKTIIKKLIEASENAIAIYVDNKGLDKINKNINNNGIEATFDDIMEKIETGIETNPPAIEVDFQDFHDSLREGIVQMWGASQSIYMSRS